jgi:serine/threonine-protein kinase RsbW
MVVPSRFGEIAAVQDAVLTAAQAHGYDDAQLFAIKLSLEEALTNAIKHGNQLDPDKQVTIEFQVSPEQVAITVCDEGGGFTPDAVPDPTLDENLEKPCGRGVMLIRAYMTEATYNDSGNCLTMIKRRSCPLPRRTGS